MYPNSSSPFQGLAKVILVLFVLGAFVGLALSNTDVMNFLRNGAEADRIKQENAIQAQRDAINMKYYAAIQDSVIQNQQERLAADQQAYLKSLEQQQANERAIAEQNLRLQAQKAQQELETGLALRYILIGSVIFITTCLGVGIALLIWQIGYSRVLRAKAAAQETSPWMDRKWRQQQIEVQRKRERAARKNTLQPAMDGVLIPWEELSKPRRVTIEK